MFAMTAAHPTLALPSYVRVTRSSPANRSSCASPIAALFTPTVSSTSPTPPPTSLGLINGGSGQVEVEAIIPGDASGTTYAQTTPPARPVLGEPDGIAQIAQRSALEDMPTQAPVLAANSVDTTQPKGIHLQLGAFSNADNAENLKNHLSRELPNSSAGRQPAGAQGGGR
jgi:rare lipoprotein A